MCATAMIIDDNVNDNDNVLKHLVLILILFLIVEHWPNFFYTDPVR